MKPDTPLDYAIFQLSPKRSRCELYVSRAGNTEKLASGSVKPFVTHLKVAEEQASSMVQSIKLEVEKYKNAETWFTKGTLERFVRFVSTPEVLELVSTFDAEMSQLEGARRIYSQGTQDQPTGGDGAIAAADATKKELLRAIDVRLAAVRQDLTTSYSRAVSAGFTPDAVSELQLFADQFGASRLNESCSKFISLCDRRPDLINPWKAGADDRAVRSSCESDMSIDEDPSEELANGRNQHLEQSKPATWQQLTKSSSFAAFPLRRSRGSRVDRDEVKESEEKKEDSVKREEPPVKTSHHVRRLSVQDRINLFENKQKENSSGSGGKPVVVGKSAELRRLSSDVSSGPTAAEKAVLRRWSGISDMSISVDLTGERKEFESPLGTPSSSVSQNKSDEPDSKNFIARVGDGGEKHDEVIETKVESGSVTMSTSISLGFSQHASEASKLTSNLERLESDFRNYQTGTKTQAPTQTQSTSSKGEDSSSLQPEVRSSPDGRVEQVGLTSNMERLERDFRKYQTGTKTPTQTQIQSRFSRADADSPEDRVTVQPQMRSLPDERVEKIGLSDQKKPKAFISREVHGEMKEQAVSEKRNRNNEFKQKKLDLLTSQSQEVASKEVGEEREKETRPSDRQSVTFATEAADSGPSKMKLQKQGYLPEKVKRSQTKREESNADLTYSRPSSSNNIVPEGHADSVTVSAVPVEQLQRENQQAKGNQDLNDELKLKANELEKLFAEHKLRGGPAEQTSFARRNKTTDKQMEQEVSLTNIKKVVETQHAQLPEKKTSTESIKTSSNMLRYCVTPPMTPLMNRRDGGSLENNLSEFGLSDDSRGKFYDKYTQKRDAKLREGWGSNRADKEAKMKAMQDSFERSRADMEAKFAGSSYKQDSSLGSQRHAEGLRSFNTRSTMKREQHPIDFLQDGDEEDLSDLVDTTPLGHARSLSETSLGDSAAKSIHSKRPLPSKTLSSSTSRTPVAPVPKSAAKASNTNFGRRKMQPENPLAQSVPNFSDLRKENTKPSSGITKPSRLQARNYSRNRNTIEENPLSKEEKSCRSQFLRKSSAGPAEFKEWSSLDFEGASLNPTKFDKEQMEATIKDVESKPFLRKGNGVGPGAGTLMAKMKASMEISMHEEENFDTKELDNTTSEEEEEEEEQEEIITEDHHEIDSEKQRLSQDSGSEIGDAMRSFSQIDPSFTAESPVSWNSRMQHAFSYANETSDIDASADSPMGSPWNQADADAARMRKKWGRAQKPFVVSSSSLSHPRKDVTKGFKRLLKFGRKSRGTDSLVDWISATTSEGDDDTEDVRDLGNRSSEDLRKTRMGFSQTHTPDHGFNESEFYSQQVQALRTSIPAPPAHFKLRDDHLSGSSIKVPRSFFSLSSFRSKASDSKRR